MKLTARQIQRLQKIRKTRPEGSLSYDQFRHALSAPFTSQTLLNALRGRNVNPMTYHFLVGVLQRHDPEVVPTDGKSAAAGETDTEELETDVSQKSDMRRGSR